MVDHGVGPLPHHLTDSGLMAISEQPQPEKDTTAVAESSGASLTSRLWFKGLLLAMVIGLILWANIYAAEHNLIQTAVQRFGYPGIFFASVLSGFNLIVPFPVVGFFPLFMDAGLDPRLTIATIAVGMTAGDLLGFALGRVSRDIFAPKMENWLGRIERMKARHPYLPVGALAFYASFVPLPNELLVIPMAFLRYRLISIFFAVLFGNLVFNSMAAFGVAGLFESF